MSEKNNKDDWVIRFVVYGFVGAVAGTVTGVALLKWWLAG